MKIAPTILGIAGALMLAPALDAGLVFEQKLIELHAGPDDDVVTAEFRFRIEGDAPVVIKEYEAACSCLKAEISDGGRLEWKPGETGAVKASFKMGTFTGTVDKHIVLRLRDQLQPEKLTVRVTIPVLFQLEPQTLFWDLNGSAKPQSFKILVKHDKPIKIEEISGTNEQFDHELKTLREGWEYEVVVTPKNVSMRAFGLLRIRNDCEFKRHQSVQGFVVVRLGQGPKALPPAK